MAKRIKSFSRKFLPFIITGLTILVTVPTASFSLLHPQSVNAQQVSRGNGYVSIQLPSTGNQDDKWSCGPNSAARILAFYGHDINYNSVRSAVNKEFMFPPSFEVPDPTWTNPFRKRRVDIRTGTTPHVLRDVMKRWEGENVKLERKADFATLQRVLNEGKPVVALVRVGSIDTVVSGTWPEMHWISVTGFNEQKREIYYTDTDGANYYYTYDEFLGNWDWRVGTGFASEALYKNGVQSRTMIWVDRTPSSLASSPSSSSPDSSSSSSPDSSPSSLPVFDADFYLMSYGDLRNAFGTNQGAAKNHWLTYGTKEGRRSSPAFDVQYYLSLYPDLQNAFGSSNYSAAVNHWLTYGIKEGRRSSIVFDAKYYLNKYPDLQNAFGSSNYSAAVNHWLTYGVSEGRQGSPDFDPKFYLSNNPDVAKVYGANNYKGAIEHYLEYGKGEGRKGTP